MGNRWSLWSVYKATWLIALWMIILFLAIAYLFCRTLMQQFVGTSDYIAIIALAVSIIPPLLRALGQPIFRVEVESVPIFSKSQDGDVPSSWFHRFYVINDGLVPAQNCVGKLIEIRDENGNKLTKYDPALIYWTHQNPNTGFKPVSIFGRGDYAILDIFQEKAVSQLAGGSVLSRTVVSRWTKTQRNMPN